MKVPTQHCHKTASRSSAISTPSFSTTIFGCTTPVAARYCRNVERSRQSTANGKNAGRLHHLAEPWISYDRHATIDSVAARYRLLDCCCRRTSHLSAQCPRPLSILRSGPRPRPKALSSTKAPRLAESWSKAPIAGGSALNVWSRRLLCFAVFVNAWSLPANVRIDALLQDHQR